MGTLKAAVKKAAKGKPQDTLAQKEAEFEKAVRSLKKTARAFKNAFGNDIQAVAEGLREFQVDVYPPTGCEGKAHKESAIADKQSFGNYPDFFGTDRYALDEHLERLLSALQATTKPAKFCLVHDDQTNNDDSLTTLFSDGNSFITWIKKLLPELDKEVSRISKKNDWNSTPLAERKIVVAYNILTQKLLPEWEKDDYLQKTLQVLSDAENAHQALEAEKNTIKAAERAKTLEGRQADFVTHFTV